MRADIWWFARSMFLCAGCDGALPWLRFQPAGEPDTVRVQGTNREVVFGFRVDAAMQGWAQRHGATVAMPPPEIARHLGDKIYLPTLARKAGVVVPRSVTRRSASHREARGMWYELGAERAVAQLADNDLTGAGTRCIDSVDELVVCLEEWASRDVKLAEYVEGLPLTVSGVVTHDAVVVSGISYQLVGYERLTPLWGAHCGNQLLDDALLPPDVGSSCRDTCRRVGAVLGRSGFRGMFGIDVVARSTEIVVLELNPRMQSVTSLLNAAELGAGLLPSPLLHVLSFLTDRTPQPIQTSSCTLPGFGQLVVSSMVSGQVSALPKAGVHQLTTCPHPECALVGPQAPLGVLRPGQALVWPMTSPRARLDPADRLYVLQTPDPVAACPDGSLTERALAWLEALDRQSCVEGAAG